MPLSPVARGRAGLRDHDGKMSDERTARLSLASIGLFSVVLGVPLAVVWEAAGPYDDPKAWALVILTAGTGLAWLAQGRGMDQRSPSSSDRSSAIIRWVVLGYVTWAAVTTVTSVAPLQSALGSFGRGMGLVTIGSTTLLFFVIQSECRSARAVLALVDGALLGSVPVCLLALGQAAGWDPLPKPWDPAVRSLTVRSTLGSHIFLGGYLVALIPLAAARLEWAFRQRAASDRWPVPTHAHRRRALVATAWTLGAVVLIGLASRWSLVSWMLVPWGIAGAVIWAYQAHGHGELTDTALTAWGLAGLLVSQVLVVILSRGRGALVGMLVGLAVTTLAFLVRREARKVAAGVVLGLIGLTLFLVLLNLPGSPVASLGQMSLLRRLSDIANVQRGSPGWFRLQVWRGIVDGWERLLRGDEVFPAPLPRARAFVGYGPETQLLALDPLTAPFLGGIETRTATLRARYVADRAHNYVLDHLVTEGLVGATLYILLAGAVVSVGIRRIRTGQGAGETTIRIGALGAVLAHLADGQVGIATAMSFALFWLAAALLTGQRWLTPLLASRPALAPRAAVGTRWWAFSLAVAVSITVLVAWASTRWLFASVAYADGVRHAMAGRMVAAHEDFRTAVALAPWLPLPAEAGASAALRLAGSEPDAVRRLDLLHEAKAMLAGAGSYAMSGAGAWTLTGQIALAEARTGDRGKLAISRDAFATALRLRPGDPNLLAQWAWVWLESGDAERARQIADEALARDPREWLAWAVLARSARVLGDRAVGDDAARKAHALAPMEAQSLVAELLR